MSKKSCPIFIVYSIHKNRQDFLDFQYTFKIIIKIGPGIDFFVIIGRCVIRTDRFGIHICVTQPGFTRS